MTLLDQAKLKVAQRMGFLSWKMFTKFVKPTDEIVDKVAKLYANAKLDEAATNHKDTHATLSDYEYAVKDILKLKDQIQ